MRGGSLLCLRETLLCSFYLGLADHVITRNIHAFRHTYVGVLVIDVATVCTRMSVLVWSNHIILQIMCYLLGWC
jgi:hypothetical protein